MFDSNFSNHSTNNSILDQPKSGVAELGLAQAWYDLDYRIKVVCLNGQTLEIFSDLNPVSHGGHLTLFWPSVLPFVLPS